MLFAVEAIKFMSNSNCETRKLQINPELRTTKFVIPVDLFISPSYDIVTKPQLSLFCTSLLLEMLHIKTVIKYDIIIC